MDDATEVIGEALCALVILAFRHRSRALSLTATSTLGTLERTGPRRLTDLAATEGVTQPSMTAVVAQLVELGLAERRKDPSDARVCVVAITPAGELSLASVRQSVAVVLRALVERLPDQELAALRAALPALRRLLDIGADCDTAESSLPGGSTSARR